MAGLASLRAVDAAYGVALQRDGGLGLALLHGLPRAGKLGGNALAFLAVPAPSEQSASADDKEYE